MDNYKDNYTVARESYFIFCWKILLQKQLIRYAVLPYFFSITIILAGMFEEISPLWQYIGIHQEHQKPNILCECEEIVQTKLTDLFKMRFAI